LDTYALERRPHVEAIVEASLRLGELISIIDPQRAAERDRRLRSGTLAPPEPMPALVDGVLQRGEDGTPRAPAGELSLQARVELDGRAGLFDDVVGGGWVVLTTGWAAAERLAPATLQLLELIEARVIRIESTSGTVGAAVDVDGLYLAWLQGLTAQAIVVRPDFYVFGAARDAGELELIVEDLRRQLSIRRRTRAAASMRAR
jgi:hypothetical protein